MLLYHYVRCTYVSMSDYTVKTKMETFSSGLRSYLLHNAHIYFMHTSEWVKCFVFAFSNLLLLLPPCYLFAKFITSGFVAYRASHKPSQQCADEFKPTLTHTHSYTHAHPPWWLPFHCCKSLLQKSRIVKRLLQLSQYFLVQPLCFFLFVIVTFCGCAS